MRALILLALLVGACGDDHVSRTLGARCDRPDDCADRCLAPSADYPGGLCTVDCFSSGDCPDGAQCIESEGGVCLYACREPRDCEFLGPGWSCKAEPLRSDQTQQVLVCRGD